MTRVPIVLIQWEGVRERKEEEEEEGEGKEEEDTYDRGITN